MNKISAIISQIQTSGAIVLVDLNVEGQTLSAMLIESADEPQWMSVGQEVMLAFKETEVSLARNFSGLLSMRNQLNCRVVGVERGGLMSKVIMRFHHHTIVSAITTRSVDAMNISIGDEITALVKSNEMSIIAVTQEVLNTVTLRHREE